MYRKLLLFSIVIMPTIEKFGVIEKQPNTKMKDYGAVGFRNIRKKTIE